MLYMRFQRLCFERRHFGAQPVSSPATRLEIACVFKGLDLARSGAVPCWRGWAFLHCPSRVLLGYEVYCVSNGKLPLNKL